MTPFNNFTALIRTAEDIDPTVGRWLEEVQGLQRKLEEHVVWLCRYFDRIPESAQQTYANALLDALVGKELEKDFSVSTRLCQRISEFAVCLEMSGELEQANSIREAIAGRSNCEI